MPISADELRIQPPQEGFNSEQREGLDSFNENFVAEFRANGGVTGSGPFDGVSGLLLHTIGAKSGEPKVTPLYHLDFAGRWYLAGSFGGSPKAPAWVHNLRARPRVTVEVGTDTVAVTAVELPAAEREKIWAVWTARIPILADYQAKTDRVIPLFELVREGQGPQRHVLPEGAQWYEPGAVDLVNPGVLEEFRANGGEVGGRYEGMPLIVLHTVGAKSGEPRTNPLYRFDFAGRWFVVGSFGGSPKAPAWVRNLRARPQARVEVPGQGGAVEHADVTARELAGAEREGVWTALIEQAPAFAGYQAKTDRLIPLFELVRE